MRSLPSLRFAQEIRTAERLRAEAVAALFARLRHRATDAPAAANTITADTDNTGTGRERTV